MKASLSAERSNGVEDIEMQRVLRARAEALSRPADDGDVVEGIQVVVLRIGAESYGVDAAHLNEVRLLGRLSIVPNVPSLWSGLIALRGTLFPVLDLARYLGIARDPDVMRPTVAIVSVDGIEAALLIDEATEVRHVPLQDMGSLGSSEMRTNGIRAITSDLLSIIDLGSILADPRLEIANRSSDQGGDQ